MSDPPFHFRGFLDPTTTPVPDQVFDELLSILSLGELKVLLYIIRRTYGFKKTSDDISLSQICTGITKKGGEILDRGTGLHRETASRAIKNLIDKGIINAAHHSSPERGFETTTYALARFDPWSENPTSHPHRIRLGLVGSDPSPLVGNSDLQQTVNNMTVNNNMSPDWKTELAETMTASNYARWVAPLEVLELVNNHAVLSAPDAGTADYARTRLADTLTRALNVEGIEVRAAK